jgi:hypothetical protein
MSDLPSFQEITNILQGKSQIPTEDLNRAQEHIINVFNEVKQGCLKSLDKTSEGYIIKYNLGTYSTDVVFSITDFCKPLTNWITNNGYQSDIQGEYRNKELRLSLTVYLYKKDTSALAQMRE